jgi:hypothetical protein
MDCARREGRNVLSEPDVAHEAGKPWPHGKAIELSQQGGVMKADPANRAFFDRFGKRRHRVGCPIIGRIIQLDEHTILCKEGGVDRLCVFNVIYREIVSLRLFLQPDFGRIDKGLEDATGFSDSNYFELW